MNIQFSIRRFIPYFILRHQNLRQLLCLQLLLLVLFNFVATISFSQISQNGIFFQAVAKDNYDNPANRRQLFLQTTIIQSNANGSKVLIEEFQTTTDQMGIFNFTIGKAFVKALQASTCVVANFSFNNPEAANKNAPVQKLANSAPA